MSFGELPVGEMSVRGINIIVLLKYRTFSKYVQLYIENPLPRNLIVSFNIFKYFFLSFFLNDTNLQNLFHAKKNARETNSYGNKLPGNYLSILLVLLNLISINMINNKKKNCSFRSIVLCCLHSKGIQVIDKSSHSKMFFKIGDLKSFAIFTGKYLSWSLFLTSCRPELQGRPATLLQRESSTGAFM